ncbi:MAG: hypothetical protein EDX89_24195 [Acidobacteria bacterium]|nr:MAG: hypothetical protein EDX89_24195 [Acidobacteriota bacterium]
MRRLFLGSLLTIGLSVAIRASAEDCLLAYLDVPALTELAQQTSVADLRTRYATLESRDYLLDVVYRTRLAELSRGSSTTPEFCDLLPRSRVEFDYLYRLTYPESEGSHPLEVFFDRFLQFCAAEVRRNPGLMSRFIQLSEYADGEALDIVQELSRDFHTRQPKAFMSAFRKVSPIARAKWCGDRPDPFCQAP